MLKFYWSIDHLLLVRQCVLWLVQAVVFRCRNLFNGLRIVNFLINAMQLCCNRWIVHAIMWLQHEASMRMRNCIGTRWHHCRIITLTKVGWTCCKDLHVFIWNIKSEHSFISTNCSTLWAAVRTSAHVLVLVVMRKRNYFYDAASKRVGFLCRWD